VRGLKNWTMLDMNRKNIAPHMDAWIDISIKAVMMLS
jgi:hypothetical protein